MRREIIIDNFAGGGGTSMGIAMALGRGPDVAINHDPEAIAMHIANHPDTVHLCEDVFDVDPVDVAAGRPVGMAWFSPDCKHFSKAKGGKPVEKKIRGLAWVVVKYAAKVRPRIIILENVEEFQTWGPLTADNKPCPKRRGLTFRRWCKELGRLGYRLEMRELRACDYGAPTIRKRLFIIARCDGQPIAWPEPTHGEGLEPYHTAADCIDWSIPCPSIFERKRPLAEKTLQRIANGIRRYVIECEEPFIVPLTHAGGLDRVYDINQPLHTVTGAQRGELAVVTPYLAGVGGRFGQSRPREMGEPMQTITGKGDAALIAPTLMTNTTGHSGAAMNGQVPTLTTGNHQALVSAFLSKYHGQNGNESRCNDSREPIRTLDTQNRFGIVTSHLMKFKGTCRHGQPVMKPMPTVQAGGLHVAEVRAFLINYYSNGSGKTGAAANKPMPTIPTRDRIGLVTIHGIDYQIVDIGMRMLQPRELYRAQGFPDSYIIAPEYNGKPLTKTAQVRMCGNSVPPPIAAALVRANCYELAEAA